MAGTGAGIVFKSETHVLMGFQPHKAMISGIGGKSHDLEPLLHTALREAIEELFGVNPTHWLLLSLAEIYKNAGSVQNGGYTMFILPITELSRFMMYVEVSVGTSPYYAQFPKTLDNLLFQRRTPADAEVTHLVMIPLVADYFRVDQRDMPLIV
jgi:hypothetical protein